MCSSDLSGDTVVENDGEGIDQVLATVSYTLTGHVENLTLGGSALDGTGIASILTGLPVAAVHKNGVLRGLLQQGLQEAVPEAGFTAAVNSVLPARTPSYSSYAMQPMPAEAPPSADERNRAEAIAESLGRDQYDSLWNERNKAHRSVVGSLLDYLPSSPTLWGAVQ